jgi:N-acetylneuraminic acid mutarotase
MLVYDFRTGRWSSAPGPTPRQHLGAVAAGGKVYAVGGRIGGADRNLDAFEAYDPKTRRWRALPPVPEARGGTGLAAVGSTLVSVGGETPTTTLGKVYAYDIARAAWRQLDDLAQPRHGLAVVGLGKRVYAIAGGPTPGCSQSPSNEVLELG